MRIEHLKYLVDVAETGSISQAADRLYISQQGLSQAIRQLEKHLGASLLNRTGNRISLTELGWKAAEKSKELLEKYDELLELIAVSEEKKDVENLILLTTPYLAGTVLPEIVTRFSLSHPQVNLTIHEFYPEEIMDGIKNEPTAIGLFSAVDYKLESFDFAAKDLRFDPFFYADLMVLTSKHSALAKKKSVSVAELINYPMALYDFRPNVEMHKDIFAPVGKINVVLKTANKALIREMVANGKAISIFNDFSELFEKKDNVAYVKLEYPSKFVLGWLYAKDSPQDSIRFEFINEMNKCIKKILSTNHLK